MQALNRTNVAAIVGLVATFAAPYIGVHLTANQQDGLVSLVMILFTLIAVSEQLAPQVAHAIAVLKGCPDPAAHLTPQQEVAQHQAQERADMKVPASNEAAAMGPGAKG